MKWRLVAGTGAQQTQRREAGKIIMESAPNIFRFEATKHGIREKLLLYRSETGIVAMLSTSGAFDDVSERLPQAAWEAAHSAAQAACALLGRVPIDYTIELL